MEPSQTDDFGRLLTSIGIGLTVAVWIVVLLRWTIDGDLNPLVAALGVAVALGAATLVIWAPYPWVSAVVFVSIVATIVFFPFALEQVSQREMRLLDTREFEKAHQAFAANPANVAAHLAIARHLANYGMLGHAIVIADNAIASLPDQIDPVQNRSVRDLFEKEIRMLKEWKTRATAESFKPAPCVRCKQMNPPGTISCLGCGGPFLLDLARDFDIKSKFIGRLVLSWAIVAIVIIIAPYSAVSFGFKGAIVSIAASLVAAGFLLFKIHRKRSILP